MKNIHILPTDKPSRLVYNSTTKKLYLHKITAYSSQSKNIYITSDEKIKEGDAYITKNGEICKSHNGSKILLFKTDKKIILTTDQDLIKYNVQAIDDKFLKWFVKSPSCEWVEINFSLVSGSFKYIIIIPKEELKQELSTRLKNSLIQFNINLDEVFDLPDWKLKTIGFSNRSILELKTLKEESKQETLEEATEKRFPKSSNQVIDFANELRREGAKWQQERSYSEEEMHKLMDDYQNYLVKTNEPVKTFKEWFEQFKKK